MTTPFPGMDPYLEHPSLWPDVHDSLIAAIRDALTPLVAPKYYVGLERRAYLLDVEEDVFVGRPDVSLATAGPVTEQQPQQTGGSAGVVTVDVPVSEEVDENYLEIRDVRSGVLVTVIDLLSPANKLHTDGRRQYEEKRREILRTRTNLIEIDLMRAGESMPVIGPAVRSDYRILVSRGRERPRAHLHTFSLRDPIPSIPIPLLPEDDEPTLDLNHVVHELYSRARFDLRLDYTAEPEPPLDEEDAAWADEVLHEAGLR